MSEIQIKSEFGNLAESNVNIKEPEIRTLVRTNVEKHFKCHLCVKSFFTLKKQREHLNSAHKLNLERGQCHICSHMCGPHLTQHLLNTHNMVQDLMAFVPCSICGATRDKSQMKRHMKHVHEKLYKSKCEICKKTLATKHTLNKHILQVIGNCLLTILFYFCFFRSDWSVLFHSKIIYIKVLVIATTLFTSLGNYINHLPIKNPT